MISALTPAAVEDHLPGLSALLADTVTGGASIGFLAPMPPDAAAAWWRAVAGRLGEDHLAWAAHDGDRVVGTVQLVRATAPNSRHRGDVAKLMVHPDARGRGLARALLEAVDSRARELGVTLLVLDTETGSPAETLYEKAGWTRVGEIPDYALDPHGRPHPTTVFWKRPTGSRPNLGA
ncbi:GNAT family N-acetyltransferase [Phytomonospora sp. NPDC050363]|uniref:GNAT family N-acetyltransferase n=1 Tax=Phytomonospora sp. NPDC050363 TaxID=3155642 RepID=UPI0034040CE4